MTCAKRALVILLFATLGIWGCAQGPESSSKVSDQIKYLEAKTCKLEDDFRAAATARDQVRKKMAAAEEQYRQAREELEQQIQTITQERDEARKQLASRTSQLDSTVTQYEQFRKNIRELLGHAEAAANPTAPKQPTTTARLEE